MSRGSLTAEQADQYWTRGYVNQIPVLTAEEAQDYQARLEAIETAQEAAQGGKWWPRDYRPWEMPTHPMWDIMDELVHHPRLLDAVESILGPNILVRNADVFIKQPRVRRGIGWHLDTAEKGPDTDRILTAWLGLTASTPANGSLQFSGGSHRVEIPNGPKDKYTLTLKPDAVQHLRAEDTFVNEMDPGMASLHHFRLAHRSGPNQTRARRIGFVVRFMSPEISRDVAESGSAVLVRGSDTTGHFTLKDRFPMTWTM